MRRFSPEYLEQARRGMWEDRQALVPLELESRERILDVGCGTGEFTDVLREESTATVVGLDADRDLLRHATADDRVVGDATALPFADDAFDLVVCQALLVNLPEPGAAVRELARVSSDMVAAIEPNNAEVRVDSTVGAEPRLSRRARQAFVAGIDTDVTLGADAAGLFREAGLEAVASHRHSQRRTIESPYSDAALEGAARKARGTRLEDHRRTLLRGDLDPDGFEELKDDWRAMGRAIVDQMGSGEYRRAEVVPFYVTVGRQPD